MMYFCLTLVTLLASCVLGQRQAAFCREAALAAYEFDERGSLGRDAVGDHDATVDGGGRLVKLGDDPLDTVAGRRAGRLQIRGTEGDEQHAEFGSWSAGRAAPGLTVAAWVRLQEIVHGTDGDRILSKAMSQAGLDELEREQGVQFGGGLTSSNAQFFGLVASRHPTDSNAVRFQCRLRVTGVSFARNSEFSGPHTNVWGVGGAAAWTHLACVYDGEQLSVVVNQTVQGSVPLTGTVDFSGRWPLYAGAQPFFEGRGGSFDLDELYVFGRGLSQAELADVALGRCLYPASGMSAALIAAVAAAVFLLVALAFAGVLVWLRRRRASSSVLTSSYGPSARSRGFSKSLSSNGGTSVGEMSVIRPVSGRASGFTGDGGSTGGGARSRSHSSSAGGGSGAVGGSGNNRARSRRNSTTGGRRRSQRYSQKMAFSKPEAQYGKISVPAPGIYDRVESEIMNYGQLPEDNTVNFPDQSSKGRPTPAAGHYGLVLPVARDSRVSPPTAAAGYGFVSEKPPGEAGRVSMAAGAGGTAASAGGLYGKVTDYNDEAAGVPGYIHLAGSALKASGEVNAQSFESGDEGAGPSPDEDSNVRTLGLGTEFGDAPSVTSSTLTLPEGGGAALTKKTIENLEELVARPLPGPPPPQ